jgi:hypothetical protein
VALAWERVKKNRGSVGIDAVTIEQFELRQAYSKDVVTMAAP